MSSYKSVEISNGISMPLIGLGTYKIVGVDVVHEALDAALSAGYRFVDTAQLYKNEAEIGQALAALLPKHGLDRKDIFITTKLDTSNMLGPRIRESFSESLAKLRTDYVDLFMVHYPKAASMDDKDVQNEQIRSNVWSELEQLLGEGKVRSIGVSNYEIRHLQELSARNLKPSVNQCEFHPHFQRPELLDYCRRAGVHFQSFSTLARQNPALHGETVLGTLAEKYQSSTSQIILAWAMSRGVSVLPKSADPQRIRSNFRSVTIQLTAEEVGLIDVLDRNHNYISCTPWNVL